MHNGSSSKVSLCHPCRTNPVSGGESTILKLYWAYIGGVSELYSVYIGVILGLYSQRNPCPPSNNLNTIALTTETSLTWNLKQAPEILVSC